MTLLNVAYFSNWENNGMCKEGRVHPLYWWLPRTHLQYINTLRPRQNRHYLIQCWPISMLPYGVTRPQWEISLDPRICGSNFKYMILEHTIMVFAISNISQETALRWCYWSLWWSTLSHIMAWCHQPTSHNLNQYWRSSMMSHGITRSQWVNTWRPVKIAAIS